jgi:uncharacterized protein (TIGR03437 family)
LATAANLPTFTYYLANVQINAVATDSTGNTYITGVAVPGAFTATAGAFQTQGNSLGCVEIHPVDIPCDTAFVIKLDPAGAVVFATYLGNGGTVGYGIAVDAQGNVYVAGTSDSFPVTPGAAFTNSTGYGFVAKLNPSGSQLLYGTYVPYARVMAMAVDLAGNAYLTGYTSGTTFFPATAGAFQTSPKSNNNLAAGIVAKLNASGSALVYATYLSGSAPNGDNPTSIAVDAAGNAFIAGWTFSSDFPVTSGAYVSASPFVGASVFLTKLNPQGSGLVYSANLGPGGAASQFTTVATVTVKLDGDGNAFVAGSTGPASVRTIPGVFAGDPVSGTSYLTRFSADGSSLVYSNVLPTVFYSGAALDVDSAGNAVVAGAASSLMYFPGAPDYTMPAGAGAFQPQYAGGDTDVYVTRFTPDGQPAGSTYLGGSQTEWPQAIALAPNGSVVVVGLTNSPDFPGAAPPVTLQPGFTAGFATNIFPSLTMQNAASLVATGIAPGEIVALRGYGIGPSTGVTTAGPAYPNQLGGVQISFGGFAAPLFYAQSGQVNAQVPWEIAGQTTATLQISVLGTTPTNTGTPIVVAPSLPGIFFINNSDGTRNSPTNPAMSGDFIAIYGTGGGTTHSPGVTGQTWGLTPLSNLDLAASVFVGGQNAEVLYAGSAPGLESGIFQINAVLPAGMLANASLYITIGNASSIAVPIAVQ